MRFLKQLPHSHRGDCSGTMKLALHIPSQALDHELDSNIKGNKQQQQQKLQQLQQQCKKKKMNKLLDQSTRLSTCANDSNSAISSLTLDMATKHMKLSKQRHHWIGRLSTGELLSVKSKGSTHKISTQSFSSPPLGRNPPLLQGKQAL